MQHLSNLSDSSPNHVNFIFKLTSAFVFGRCWCFFSLHHSSTDRCLLLTTLFALQFFFYIGGGKKPSHLKQTFWKWRKRESVIPLEKGKLIKTPCSLFSSTELLYFWWVVKRTITFYKLGTITVFNPSNTRIYRLIKIFFCAELNIKFLSREATLKLHNILTELFVWVDEHLYLTTWGFCTIYKIWSPDRVTCVHKFFFVRYFKTMVDSHRLLKSSYENSDFSPTASLKPTQTKSEQLCRLSKAAW